jgi:UDP-N-acetyl-D-mannosaminuronic acid dehydrogenase
MTKSKVCVVGLGYIGLPTSALLANRGYDVLGVDIAQDVVDTINQGKIHIVEPELDTFVCSAVESGRFIADTKPDVADIFIIAVPTPFRSTPSTIDDQPSALGRHTPIPNIDYVISATRSIAPYVREGNIVILESTSPVGTTDKVEEVLKEEGVDTSKLHIAHCPERVLPGRIMCELIENDRIIGGTTPEATKITADFYREFVQGEVLETDAKTAEMTKLTENSFRDVNIAFANELSMLCDQFGIDVLELIRLANRHPRVNILQPGCGVGGHCIAVDPWFIVDAGKGSARLIETARRVNDYKSEWVIEKVKNAISEWKLNRLRHCEEQSDVAIQSVEPKVAVMGLAFKPDIDDLRESPALYIAKRLTSELENIVCVEPNIQLDYFTDNKVCHPELDSGSKNANQPQLVDLDLALDQSDIQVFLVAHKEFKKLSTIDYQPSTNLDFCGVLK